MDQNNASKYEQKLSETRNIWNAEAASFDNEPDHGLRDPIVLEAWTDLLKSHLPAKKGALLDIGCGTGSLSIVLAGFGYDVTGIDLSPEMILRAEAKAHATNQTITFQVMDAAFPQFSPQQFDVVICRHILWALPETDQILQRWVRLLKPGGRLLMIEGFWHTNAGLHAQDILDAIPASLTKVVVQNLSDQADLWGRPVNDERYIIRGDLQS